MRALGSVVMSILGGAIRLSLVLLFGLGLTGLGLENVVHAQDTKVVRIGAGPTGATDFPFGGLLANAISNPPGSRDCDRGGNCGVPGLIAVAQTTADAVENLRGIARGDLEIGLSQADVAAWAYQGTAAFADHEPLSNLRVLARLYPETVHLIAARDSPIKSVLDLKGKRVAMGPEGSGTAATAKLILSAFGVKWRSVQIKHMEFSNIADALTKRTVDAAFMVSGAPTLTVEDMAARTPIKLVPIAGPVAEKLAQVFPFYSLGSIPAGTYAGQAAVDTLDVGSVLLGRDAMDPELAYGIVRAIWHERNVALFQAGHPRGKLMDKAKAARVLGIPILTGADRYYVQNGLMDPAAIVPPPAKPPAKAERPAPGATRL